MKVRIQLLEDDLILVTRTDGMGGGANQTIAVLPGQTYHGYKHRRLRRMGPGEHELKRTPPDVPVGTTNDDTR